MKIVFSNIFFMECSNQSVITFNCFNMSENIFSLVKPIKTVGKFFGFFPFKLDKSHKNYKIIYIINWIYASFIMFNLVLLMYFNFTIFSDFLQESALIPILINRISQTIPITINIAQTLGIFIHIQSFYKISVFYLKKLTIR